jgi:uncharacterized membrane protein
VLTWGIWSGGYMHGMTGMRGYGWWFTPLLLLAFLVLLALGAYYITSLKNLRSQIDQYRATANELSRYSRSDKRGTRSEGKDERRVGIMTRKRLTLGIVLVSIGLLAY